MGYILVMDSLHFFDGCYFLYFTASGHMIWYLLFVIGKKVLQLVVVLAWNGMFKGHKNEGILT